MFHSFMCITEIEELDELDERNFKELLIIFAYTITQMSHFTVRVLLHKVVLFIIVTCLQCASFQNF